MKNIILFLVAVLSLQYAQSQCGTTNIAIGKTVTASTHLDQFSVPGNITDNNSTTNWKSESNADQWIMIDLGQSYAVCNIELSWSTSFTYPTSYTVEVSQSSTANSGTIVHTTTSGNGAVDQISISTPVTGRYVRIHATVRAASWADKYELFEVVINNSTGTPPPTSGTNWQLAGNGGTTPATDFLGTTDNSDLVVKTNAAERLRITAGGKLLLNTSSSPDPSVLLAVNGDIWAKKLKITQSNWADFVFDSSYRLMPLELVAKFIKEHKHLPDVPSEKQVLKEGISIGDNQAVLLRKIEELTLYLIEQDKKIKALEAELISIKKK